MDNILRLLPPGIALWLLDEIEWLRTHSVEATIFLVLAWLVSSTSAIKRQGRAISEQLDSPEYQLEQLKDKIELLQPD